MRHEKYLPTPSVAKSVVDGLQSGNNLLERRSVSWHITPTFLNQTVKKVKRANITPCQGCNSKQSLQMTFISNQIPVNKKKNYNMHHA